MKLNQKGQATAIIAFVLIAGIMIAGIRMISQSNRGKAQAQQSDDGYSVMAKKLEFLADAPWLDAALTVGTHTEGLLTWEVTEEPGFNSQPSRTKRIKMNYKMPVSAARKVATTDDQTIGLIGYKYHDF